MKNYFENDEIIIPFSKVERLLKLKDCISIIVEMHVLDEYTDYKFDLSQLNDYIAWLESLGNIEQVNNNKNFDLETKIKNQKEKYRNNTFVKKIGEFIKSLHLSECKICYNDSQCDDEIIFLDCDGTQQYITNQRALEEFIRIFGNQEEISEQVNLSEDHNSSNHLPEPTKKVLTKEDMLKTIIQTLLRKYEISCETCTIANTKEFPENNCQCERDYEPTDEFVAEINKLLEGK